MDYSDAFIADAIIKELRDMGVSERLIATARMRGTAHICELYNRVIQEGIDA